MVKVNGIEYHEDRILFSGPSIAGKLFDHPSVGNARARTLNVTLMPYDGPNGKIPPLSEIRCFVRLKSENGILVSEWIPKGVFYADEVKRDSATGAVSISAFDAIMKMELPFDPEFNGDITQMCVITYNDGFGGIQKFRCKIGDAMPVAVAPERQGERFLTWYPDPDDTPTVVRSMLFMAHWAQKYTVIFEDGSGTQETFVCIENDPTPTPTTPTKEGHAFDGWLPELEETVTHDITYVAQWAEGDRMIPIPESLVRVYFSIPECTSNYSDLPIDEYGVYFQLTGDGAEIEKAAVFVERIENVYWAFAPAVKVNEQTLSVSMVQYVAYKNGLIEQTIFGPDGPWYSSDNPPLPDLNFFTLRKNNAGIYSRSVYPPYIVRHMIYMPGGLIAYSDEYGSGAYAAYDMNGRFQGSDPVPGQTSLHLLENATVTSLHASNSVRLFQSGNELIAYMEGGIEYAISITANGGTGSDSEQTILSETGVETYVFQANSFIPPAGRVFKSWICNGDEYQPGDAITFRESLSICPVWIRSNTVRSGFCGSYAGKNVIWEIGSDGTLSFSRTFYDSTSRYSLSYDKGATPWHEFRNDITAFVYSKDVLSFIQGYVCYDCQNLKSIAVDSIQGLEYAQINFEGCERIKKITVSYRDSESAVFEFYNIDAIPSHNVHLIIGDGFDTINVVASGNMISSVSIPRSVTKFGGYHYYPFSSPFNEGVTLYYAGTRQEWASIQMGQSTRTYLESNFTIRYNSPGPS